MIITPKIKHVTLLNILKTLPPKIKLHTKVCSLICRSLCETYSNSNIDICDHVIISIVVSDIHKITISKEEGSSSSPQIDSIEKLHALSRDKKEYTP